ncbi:MAG: permease component of ABC-type sugar transporter [Chloroflexota bacterium]|nr:permease component of ABC-type sugar transporter [Chloroflexota bacterium]
MSASVTGARGRDFRGSLRTERGHEAVVGLAFIAIPMVLFLVLQIFAIGYAFVISFFDWGIRGAREFVGLANYQELLADRVFITKAIPNTLFLTAVVVPAQMALGLALAVIVNQGIRGQTFFRAAFFFPSIASSAAIVVLFTFLTQPQGLINTVLGFFGIESNTNWTNEPGTALPSIMALLVWTTSGTMMLFYLAALQGISHELYEAAAIDGANWWSAFWKITFPLLQPAHFFVAVVSVIGALQMFDAAFIAGGKDGSPANSLTTMVLFLYQSWSGFEFGFAAAVGIVLLVLLMSLTLIQRRFFGQTPSW